MKTITLSDVEAEVLALELYSLVQSYDYSISFTSDLNMQEDMQIKRSVLIKVMNQIEISSDSLGSTIVSFRRKQWK